MRILVTGCAGFIGFHLSKRLLERGDEVIGVDNLNDYYDVNLKLARLRQIEKLAGFRFARLDIAERSALSTLLQESRPQRVVNLAGQAGVRSSLTNPHAYLDSNLVGFLNVLEGCRHNSVEHLVYASSSSVYGLNTQMPFSVRHRVDRPLSLYAVTKRANELMAHSYSHLYGLPTTGLRFFTVYGPWGRPDMSLFIFTKAIVESRPIDLFNEGKMQRDFTYIDDIIDGVVLALDRVPADSRRGGPASNELDSASHDVPFRLYNLGNSSPVDLLYFVKLIERCLGITAQIRLLPMQPGDISATCADIEETRRDLDFQPTTAIEEGVSNFVRWYARFFGLKLHYSSACSCSSVGSIQPRPAQPA